jgi:hypothetical protein
MEPCKLYKRNSLALEKLYRIHRFWLLQSPSHVSHETLAERAGRMNKEKSVNVPVASTLLQSFETMP